MDKKWTKEEIEFLIKNYSNERINILTDILKIGWTNIRAKAARLGLKRHVKYTPWTKEEDDFLIKYYPAYDKNFIIYNLKEDGVE